MVSKTTVLGAAGEYYVMCQLLRHGLIAALAPVGVPNIDIVVTDGIGARMCAVQVKARKGAAGDGGWHMSAKHEGIVSPTLFYCFVDFGLGLTDPPMCIVVPSAVVSDVLKRSYLTWLATPGRGGKPHNQTDMRRFLPDYDNIGVKFGFGNGWLEPYKENWELIVGQAKEFSGT